jgi:hypothetical protein
LIGALQRRADPGAVASQANHFQFQEFILYPLPAELVFQRS